MSEPGDRSLKVVITRFDPDQDEVPRTQEYEIPVQQDWKVRASFSNSQAAHHVHKHIMGGQADAAVAMQYGQQHGQAVVFQADRNPARVGQVAVIHQGLKFEHHRPRALAGDGNNAAGRRF